MGAVYGFEIQVEGDAVKLIRETGEEVDKLKRKTKELGTETKSKLGKTDNVFAGLFKFEMLKQGFQYLKTAAADIYNVGKSVESVKTSFNVLLGSVEKGEKMFNDLRKFADVTPFTSNEAYAAGQMLLNQSGRASCRERV